MRHLISYLSVGLVAASVTAACSAQGDESPASHNTAAQSAPAFTSDVGGLRIVATSILPTQRADADGARFCSEYVHEPVSPGARAARDAGWLVTGEATLSGYQAVSFVGGLEPGTSGTCQMNNGNVALFKGEALQAIAYADNSGNQSIGYIKAVDGGLRILDGDILNAPVADIHVGQDGSVTLAPVAAEDRVCNGAGMVPDINELPINEARDRLIKAGWTPAPRPQPVREVEDPRAAALAARGVTEVDSCSGTGLGYCSFDYNGPAGRLSVTTVGDGEWPTVARYGVDCD